MCDLTESFAVFCEIKATHRLWGMVAYVWWTGSVPWQAEWLAVSAFSTRDRSEVIYFNARDHKCLNTILVYSVIYF